MKKLAVLFLGLFSLLAVSLIFSPNAFAVPENAVVRQTYLLDSSNQTVLDDVNVAPGAKFTPATNPGEGYTFAYYIVNGVISDATEGSPFVVGTYLNLVAVYRPDSEFAVVFVDVSGEIIKHNDKLAQYVVRGGNATAPTNLPTKKNYVVSPTNPWSDSFDNVTENKVIKLQYELNPETAKFNITFDDNVQEVNYNQVVTLTNETDVLWQVDGETVWYGSSYSFSALSNRTITIKEGSAPTEAIVTMTEIADLRAEHNSFLGQVYVPSGDLLEVGFLRGTEHAVTFSNKTAHIASNIVPETNEFIVSIPDSITDNIRAYALVDDEGVVEAYSYVEPLPDPEELSAPFGFVHHAGSLEIVGGAYNPGEGYTGQIRFNWMINGVLIESDIVQHNSGTGIVYKYESFYNTLPSGNYTVFAQGIGNGVEALDSELVQAATGIVKSDPQLPSITLTLSDELISWNSVDNADLYDIYLNDVLVADTTGLSYLINPVALELSYGTHTFKVVASATGYQSSEDTVQYEYINQQAQPLDAPTSVTLNGDIVSWSSVANASGYRVVINGQNNDLDNVTLSFDLSTLDLPNGTYSVQVMAIGNIEDYLNSALVATEDDYIVANELTKLNPLVEDDLGNNMPNYMTNGHGDAQGYIGYMRELILKSAVKFGQSGIASTNNVGFQIFDGTTAATEMFYVTALGAGATINTLNFKDVFNLLVQREEAYKIHIVLVADPTSGYANSLPFEMDFYWKASS